MTLRLAGNLRAGSQLFRIGIGVVVLMAVLTPAPAKASVRCTHTGTPESRLRIIPYADPRIDLDFADATVRRMGRRIVVLPNPFDQADEAVRCAGPPSDVINTDQVVFRQRGLSFGTLDLSGGLPAPETVFHAVRGALAYGVVRGTAEPDSWTIGAVANALRLRPVGSRVDRFQAIFGGPGKNVAVAKPGGGSDRVDARRAQHRVALIFLKGGAGNDTLLGSPFRDAIEGGSGPDTLVGGGGMDQLFARDRFRDRVRCGPGRDSAQVDGRDIVLGCEKVDRPRPKTGGRP